VATINFKIGDNMPFPVEAEAEEVYEEGRSALGSLITQLLSIVRTIITYAIRIARQVITYAGEHPLAMTLLVCNVMIWIT
jgi:hypothetical protein